MSEQAKEPQPLSDNEYTSYLAFAVGYLYAALVRTHSSGQISATQEKAIEKDLKFIRPTLERAYQESFSHPLENVAKEDGHARES